MKTSWCWLKLSLLFFSLWACPRTAHAYYDPGIQRWINRDPIAEKGGLDLYAFVLNSPVVHLDPNGLEVVHYCTTTNGVPTCVEVNLDWNKMCKAKGPLCRAACWGAAAAGAAATCAETGPGAVACAFAWAAAASLCSEACPP